MNFKTRIVLAGTVAVCLGMMLCSGHGQEAAPAAAAASAASAPAATDQVAEESTTSFWTLIKQGGALMFPLGLLSVATIALGIYGSMIVREKKMLTPEVVPTLEDALEHLRLEDAVSVCVATPSLLTNILHAGLQRISDGILDVPSMEKAMEEASVEETSGGLKMISYLSIVAQIAPMVGLLGTVSGMIKAFQKIGKGAMGKPEALAGDIGEALITTATGLLIGIPAMFLYFHLKNKYTSNVTRLGRVLGNLSHRLVAASRRAESGDTSDLDAQLEPEPGVGGDLAAQLEPANETGGDLAAQLRPAEPTE